MKKIICVILALTFCICLACPVFATESGSDFLPSPGTEPGDCDHHSNGNRVGQKDATCTEDGYTGDLICDDCGEVIEKGEVITKLPHEYKDGVCIHCGSDQDNPKTGDNSLVYVWMVVMAVAAVGLVTVAIVYRKQFANR